MFSIYITKGVCFGEAGGGEGACLKKLVAVKQSSTIYTDEVVDISTRTNFVSTLARAGSQVRQTPNIKRNGIW